MTPPRWRALVVAFACIAWGGGHAAEAAPAVKGHISHNRSTPPPPGGFVTFESGHVRPLALSDDGTRLFVVNTPDNRVEVYDTAAEVPAHIESIPVGLEPVALALSPDGHLWVVNHLSDSVSVVDLSARPARVVDTLLVGDEPRDILFAGPGNRWVFVTAAHRGQNLAGDPLLTTPGAGRADVWVFDGRAPGDAPAAVLNMFGDTLRALARDASGSRVYAAVFHSGNRTTSLGADIAAGGLPKPPPAVSADGRPAPRTGLIVQQDASGDWMDGGDPVTDAPPRRWNDRVRLDLPDHDVFTIDTTGRLPVVSGRPVSGVGTTLFNVVVNPQSGVLYVSNQEALNLTRFEGPGTRSSTLRGHFVESRITVIERGAASPRHLNKHIARHGEALGTPAEKAAALATPLGMAVTPDGSMLYVVAMGSNKVARLATSALANDTFVPAARDHVVVTGGLPTGIVLDPRHDRAYVTTRGDNGVSVIDTRTFGERAHVTMHNPEPAEVVRGRRFLFDASLTSSRGDSSCSGCHVFGDVDHLAWDLGNPDGRRLQNHGAYNVNVPRLGRNTLLHPMKGPMVTQSLRGLRGNGPMHWRGDRKGLAASGGPLPGRTLEQQALHEFNVTFTDLLGHGSRLSEADMTALVDYVLHLTYPPSPILNLDRTLTPVQAAGRKVYHSMRSDTLASCSGCHVLDEAKRRFGTDGTLAVEGAGHDEDMKIPHLRNLYTKVGRFASQTNGGSARHVGEQVRGFGFGHAGAAGSVVDFLDVPGFTLDAVQRLQVEQFVLAMDADMSPVVGQQVTVPPGHVARAKVRARLHLLLARGRVIRPRAECELVAKGVMNGVSKGWVHDRNRDRFVPDKTSEPDVGLPALLASASADGAALTFTCAPPGNGMRIGVARTGTSRRDRD